MYIMKNTNQTAGETATESIGVTEMHCPLCGKVMNEAKRWYHGDQDDLICLECAKTTEHTDTCYAGQLVSEMQKEIVLSTKAKFWGRRGTLTIIEEAN
jgi:hypothetical protein